MSPNAPAPAVLSTDRTLWLAYRIARDPHHCAVVRFHHVEEYAWGSPPAARGDEVVGDLPKGGFYEVLFDDGAGRARARRWIITFPDGPLDVRAADGEVVLRASAALGPSHALAALLA